MCNSGFPTPKADSCHWQLALAGASDLHPHPSPLLPVHTGSLTARAQVQSGRETATRKLLFLLLPSPWGLGEAGTSLCGSAPIPVATDARPFSVSAWNGAVQAPESQACSSHLIFNIINPAWMKSTPFLGGKRTLLQKVELSLCV